MGKIGFNSAGVGTALNAIKAHSYDTSKLPIQVALRLCLESTSVENALKTISSLGGIASAQHILVADSKESIGLEISPQGEVVCIEEDDSGVITHTNHFVANRSVDDHIVHPESPIRLDRVQEIIDDLIDSGIHGGNATPALLREKIFSDVHNAPQSIRRQEDLTRHPTMRSSTLFNIIMDLDPASPKAEVVIGQPGSGVESSVMTIPWA